jgi:uncharacterized protein YdhG (YjbR/CyaY superfamily)
MARPKTINEYLSSVPATHRPALKKLQAQFKKLYPTATEHIAYGTPLFKLTGHPLGAFKASKNHSSLFVWSGTALKPLAKLLSKYSVGMGTVRFEPDKPLPERIVKAVLASRAKEIEKRWPSK